MLLSVLAFLVLGLVLGGSYWLLEVGSGWLNRRSAERERRVFVELARRELGGRAIAMTGRGRDDVLLSTRVQDTLVRVTRQQIPGDFGPETRWRVELEDPIFDVPRAELQAMGEALRKNVTLPDDLALEPGKLSYTESARSVQAAMDRIVALLGLLDPAREPASARAAATARPSR